MVDIPIKIHGHTYTITGDEGQEKHVQALGADIHQRLENLGQTFPHLQHNHLLVLTCLMLADEIHDIKSNAKISESVTKPIALPGAANPDETSPMIHAVAKEQWEQALKAIYQRIENIAIRLEQL